MTDIIIEVRRNTLGDATHNALGISAGLAVLKIGAAEAGELLAPGSVLDFRPEKYRTGTFCRTPLVQIAAILNADTTERFEINFDRSCGPNLNDWLRDSMGVSACAVNGWT